VGSSADVFPGVGELVVTGYAPVVQGSVVQISRVSGKNVKDLNKNFIRLVGRRRRFI
jgi:hypothetical protein